MSINNLMIENVGKYGKRIQIPILQHVNFWKIKESIVQYPLKVLRNSVSIGGVSFLNCSNKLAKQGGKVRNFLEIGVGGEWMVSSERCKMIGEWN